MRRNLKSDLSTGDFGMAFELLSLLFLFVAGVGESNAYITFDAFFKGVGENAGLSFGPAEVV